MRKRVAAMTVRGIASLAALAVTTANTEARIVCREGFQVVNGNEIATPYCTDAYIAQVAREYGSKATAEQVRNSPSLRDEICRWVGSDIRIREDCNVDHGSDRGR